MTGGKGGKEKKNLARELVMSDERAGGTLKASAVPCGKPF